MPWPTVLHKLVSDELDDIWSAVIKRAKEHPEEVGVQGAGYGQTALHVACYRYPPAEAVRALIDACPDAAVAQNSDGETALHLASAGASEEVQVILLNKRPEVVSKVDKYGDSPMHLAAASGASIELLRKMVQSDPSVITLPNKRGITPFFLLPRGYEKARSLEDVAEGSEYADEWERASMFLKAAHFGTLNVPAGREMRILHAAAGTKCPRALLRAAARLFPKQAQVRDEEGRTPLAIAAAAEVFDEPKLDDDDGFSDDGVEEEEEPVLDGANANAGEQLQAAAAAAALLPQHDGLQVAASMMGGGGDLPVPPGNIQNGHTSGEAVSDEITSLTYLNGLHGTLGMSTGFFYPHQMPTPALLDQNPLEQTNTAASATNGLINSINQQNNAPALSSVIDYIVALNPRAASMADAEGRLPLTIAVESGKCWDDGLRSILWAAPRALETRDIKTRMYPFMVAAVGDNASCTTVYELIRTLPELVAIGIPPENKNEPSTALRADENGVSHENEKSATTTTKDAVKNNIPQNNVSTKRKMLKSGLNGPSTTIDEKKGEDNDDVNSTEEEDDDVEQEGVPLVPQCRSTEEISNGNHGWNKMHPPTKRQRIG